MTHRRPSPRRRAFTLVELLLASSMTALVAIAAAILISAISSASLSTDTLRSTQVAGNYAMNQFARTIREARGIGQRTSTDLALWMADTNGDDHINLYETGIISYDASTKRLLLSRLIAPDKSIPASTVSVAQFTNVATLRALYTGTDLSITAWASNVDSAAFSFAGQPDTTDMRLVRLYFEIGNSGQTTGFRITASPRASADYLFFAETQSSPLPGSTRTVRKYYSMYGGFSTSTGVTTLTAKSAL